MERLAVIILVIGGVGGAFFAYQKKQSLPWLISAILWALFAGFSNIESEVAWDMYYFGMWAGVAMMIVCVLMALQSRRMAQEEDEEVVPKKTDNELYEEETKGYGSHPTRRSQRHRR